METIADYLIQLYPIVNVPLKRRITFHGIFWGVMFMVFWFLVGFPSNVLIYRFVLAGSLTFYGVLSFYVCVYLLPYLYEKYSGIECVGVIIIAVVFFYFILAIETYARVSFAIEYNWISPSNKTMYELNYNVYKAGFWSYFRISNILTDTISNLFYSLPAFFLKFSRVFAKNLIEKKQLEIDFLRLQINPHFLVNTLNNIYSLVVVEDSRSPDAILSLSNLLNYVLYEASLPTVTLEKEITFLQNFVALEKIRNSFKVKVTMKVEGEMGGDIAPLILIAFIENAFKHGSGDATIQSYIDINIKVQDGTLFLGVVNSKVRTESTKHKKSLGGIGLVNVRKRLATLYPHRHSLEVIPEAFKHQIILIIQLTKK